MGALFSNPGTTRAQHLICALPTAAGDDLTAWMARRKPIVDRLQSIVAEISSPVAMPTREYAWERQCEAETLRAECRRCNEQVVRLGGPSAEECGLHSTAGSSGTAEAEPEPVLTADEAELCRLLSPQRDPRFYSYGTRTISRMLGVDRAQLLAVAESLGHKRNDPVNFFIFEGVE